jgi:transcriptional regulator with XRE-family HTH domain
MKLNGALIRDGRHRKGLTQQQLADALKISAPTIVRAEGGGDIWPTTGKLICEFLDVDLAKAVVSSAQDGDGDAA